MALSATETKFSYMRVLLNNKVLTLLGNTVNLFFRMRLAKTAYSAVRNRWPSWRGQNGVVTSLVVFLSCLAENLEW